MMMKLQAHRGVCAEFPENTMIAFQAAADQGYALIELDPKYTADGQIVMLHDSYLKRTARDADGGIPAASITELTLAQAREFEYGSWFHEDFKGEQIPTLADVLDFAEKNLGSALKFDNVWNEFPDDIRAGFLRAISARGEKVNVGLTCATVDAIREAAEAVPTATLHYDGVDLREATLKEVAEAAQGHELVIWVCFDSPATKWFKGERASVTLCERARKYGRLGLWQLSEREELDLAVREFRPDYVETKGGLKPWWIE